MDEAVSFLNEVESKLIQPQRRDEWVWVADPSDHFIIKSAYYVMRKGISEGTADAAFDELWKIKVQNKILAFAWRLLQDRLPTRRNLHKR